MAIHVLEVEEVVMRLSLELDFVSDLCSSHACQVVHRCTYATFLVNFSAYV